MDLICWDGWFEIFEKLLVKLISPFTKAGHMLQLSEAGRPSGDKGAAG